jgi:hypothetical protein
LNGEKNGESTALVCKTPGCRTSSRECRKFFFSDGVAPRPVSSMQCKLIGDWPSTEESFQEPSLVEMLPSFGAWFDEAYGKISFFADLQLQV